MRAETWIPWIDLSTTPDWLLQIILGTAMVSPFILIFGEITPKALGARLNLLVIRISAPVLFALYQASRPSRWITKRLIHIFSGSPPSGKIDESNPLQPEELLFLIEEGHQEGHIHQNELELIRNIFELDETTVGDIYTPITNTPTVLANLQIQDAFSLLKGRDHPRIPVLSPDRKEVVGILQTKDLLVAKLNESIGVQPVSSIMRKVFHVGFSTRLNSVFRRLRELQTRIAIVTGANGEPLGIITMNDILYEIFADLFPEKRK